jgi:hypothetical protein
MSFSQMSVKQTSAHKLNVGQPHFVGKVFSTERLGAKLSTYFNNSHVWQPNVWQPNVWQPNVRQPNVWQPNIFQPNVSQ